MNRKRLLIRNVELHYIEVNPEVEKTIYMFHGNSSSSDIWQPFFDNALLTKYRLIAFDLPGHGQSSRIPSQDYSVTNIAAIMADAVRAIDRQKPFLLMGLSFGGNVVVEMLAHSINPIGIVLQSTGLVGSEVSLSDVIASELVVKVLFSEDATTSEIQQYFDMLLFNGDKNLVNRLISDYEATAREFRSRFVQSIQEGKYLDEIALLRGWQGSPLVMYGQSDKIVNPNLLDRVNLRYWTGRVVKVNSAGHMPHLDQSTLIVDYVQEYFLKCSQI